MITLLSVTAGLVHGLTIVACLYASRKAVPSHRFVAFWLVGALFFVALAGLELFDFPQHLRMFLKLMAKASGHYDERRPLQVDLLLALALVSVCLALLGVYAAMRVRRRHSASGLVAIAVAGALGHLVLLAVRIVSLHAVDQIFAVTRANWILFAGMSTMVTYAAVRFALRGPQSNLADSHF